MDKHDKQLPLLSLSLSLYSAKQGHKDPCRTISRKIMNDFRK